MSQEGHQSFLQSNDTEASDPTVNTAELPEDHRVHLLHEARIAYGSIQRPPFTLKKRGEVIKSVIIPTKDGGRPKDEKATKAKIVPRPWDKQHIFWTLDLNRKRYIVKAHNGQGGMRYLGWAGDGFEETPLALSYISPAQLAAANPGSADRSLPDRSSFAPINGKRSIPTGLFDSSVSSDTTDITETSESSDSESELIDRRKPSIPAKRRRTQVSDRELDQLYLVNPAGWARADAQPPLKDNQPEPASSASTSKAGVNNREDRRKKRIIAKIEKRLDRKFDQIFTPWAGDQGLSRNVLQMIWKVISLMEDNSPQKISRDLNRALNGGDGKRQEAGGRKPTTKPYFDGLLTSLQKATGLQNAKAESVSVGGLGTPLSPSEDNQELDSEGLQGLEAVSSTRQHRRSIPSNDKSHQLGRGSDLNTSPSIVLAPQKQTRTTLIVRVAPSRKYLPLKLSECGTSQAFYSKVLGAWKISEESVQEIALTFTWKDQADDMRTMVMNSEMEGCFAHLIEQVDKASIWAEASGGDGECYLDVEIMLKE